ncbi:MAG: iron-sulfur cluster assembly accessory protein [Cytophagales bacterium]
MAQPYIDISPKALGEIKNIMQNKNIPEGYGLRIGVNGAGCAGVRQFLGFDKMKEKDDKFIINEIEVYIDKKDAMYLIGLVLDFQDDVEARGFVFRSGN